MKILNIAVIGVGWIGNIHCECYKKVEYLIDNIKIVLHTVVDINETAAIAAKKRYGFLNHSSNWHDVIECKEIDIVDICVDNLYHKDIVIAAAKAGKHIACEKPLSTSVDDAIDMVNSVNEHKVKHMINFNYRKVPAINYIKSIIEEGQIGDIYYINGLFLQDFGLNSSMTWRFERKKSGGGSIITMGSHLIDIGRYLCGNYKEVSALEATFIKSRMDTVYNKEINCDVDDTMIFLSKFENGSIGVFTTSWVSHGKKHHCEFEVFGSKGSVKFNSERLNEIELSLNSKNELNNGITNILIGEKHPYGKLFSLKTGMGIGIKESFIIQLYDFIISILNDELPMPNFIDGLNTEIITAAVLKSSAEKKWISIENVNIS